MKLLLNVSASHIKAPVISNFNYSDFSSTPSARNNDIEVTEVYSSDSGDMPREFQGRKGKFIFFFIPEDEPGNFIRVPLVQRNYH